MAEEARGAVVGVGMGALAGSGVDTIVGAGMDLDEGLQAAAIIARSVIAATTKIHFMRFITVHPSYSRQ